MRFKRCHCRVCCGWKNCQYLKCGGFVYDRKFIEKRWGKKQLERWIKKQLLDNVKQI